MKSPYQVDLTSSFYYPISINYLIGCLWRLHSCINKGGKTFLNRLYAKTSTAHKMMSVSWLGQNAWRNNKLSSSSLDQIFEVEWPNQTIYIWKKHKYFPLNMKSWSWLIDMSDANVHVLTESIMFLQGCKDSFAKSCFKVTTQKV